MAFDLNPGSNVSEPKEYFVFNNKLYFAANNGVNGEELWVYDGVNAPEMLADLNPTGSSYPSNFVNYNGKLYFAANDGQNGVELWMFDEVNSPQVLANINPTGNSQPHGFSVLNGNLYFFANDGVTGSELWMYNGTDEPSQVLDISPSGSSAWGQSIVYNNKLYFSAYTGDNYKLYQYDGVNPPSMVAGSPYANSYNFFIFDEWLYFESSWGELWRYNGEDNPVFAVKFSDESGSSFSGVAVFDNAFYFGKTLPSYSTKFYKCDFELNLTEISDLGNEEYSDIQNITRFGSNVFFCGSNNIDGYELWVYDGENEPELFVDIIIGQESSNPYDLKVISNTLYFSAFTQNYGFEVWAYDGVAQPKFYAEVNPGYIDSHPYGYIEFNNRIYFGASGVEVGDELYSMCPYTVSYISENACESFEFFDETLTESGIYEHIEQNEFGCDEKTILSLTINLVEFEIEETEGTITVTATEATYQWLNCNNGFSPIEGATEATFTPSVSGSYAVEVTQNGCTKISNCFEVTVTNIETIVEMLSIYPNPTNGIVTISGNRMTNYFRVVVNNLIGQKIVELTNSNQVDLSMLPTGMYIIEVFGNGKTFKSKVVKQ